MEQSDKLIEVMNQLYEKRMRLDQVKVQLINLRREEHEIESEINELKQEGRRISYDLFDEPLASCVNIDE